MDRNVRLLVSYDGTDFHGWQFQPGLRTVAGELSQALRRVLAHPVNLMASGRTDAGVHAAGQVVNFVTSCPIPSPKIRYAISARLPTDVAVLDSADVSAEFHATHSAVGKLYRYRIHNVPRRPVCRLAQRYTYHYWDPLDVGRMRAAASHFVGTMDFTAMASSGCRRETMVRSVFRCDIERHYDEVRIDVQGSGFLYNQVRNMVGTLIEVGRGHWAADRVAEILAGGDRARAGPTAPARGLCLQWVRYPAHLLRPDAPAVGPDSSGCVSKAV